MDASDRVQDILNLAAGTDDIYKRLTVEFVAHMTMPMNKWLEERSEATSEQVLKAITMGLGILLSGLLLMRFGKLPVDTRNALLEAVLDLHCKAVLASLGEAYLGEPKDE